MRILKNQLAKSARFEKAVNQRKIKNKTRRRIFGFDAAGVNLYFIALICKVYMKYFVGLIKVEFGPDLSVNLVCGNHECKYRKS